MKAASALYHFDGFPQWHQINRWYFDPQNTGAITTPDRLREHLLTLPHDCNFYFDTEGEWFRILRDYNVGTKQWNQQIANYHALYDIGSETKPNATMAEFSFPMRNYWHQKDEWRNKNLALAPLMKRLDAACPSIYDPNKNEEIAWSSEIDDWKEANQQVRMALEMHKHVWPFVFHRYHAPSLRWPWGWELIADGPFTAHCQAAADARFEGRRSRDSSTGQTTQQTWLSSTGRILSTIPPLRPVLVVIWRGSVWKVSQPMPTSTARTGGF